MSATLARFSRRHDRATRVRQWSAVNIATGTALFAGIATLTYPTAAAWFSDRIHATEVSGFVAEMDGSDPGELDDLLAEARAYNEDLPDGPLRDPYTLDSDGQPEDARDGWGTYVQQLTLRSGHPIARIRVPAIGVDLPVYHGTDEATLDRGIGHLYGSSLPIGGSGTHAVLTGHSGLPSATLFTGLDRLKTGDELYIDVAGEQLAYEIDQIATVAPDDGDMLRQIDGRDYVTLLTCTPIGVNSHRLLVRGERIELPRSDEGTVGLRANTTDPGFPWWTLGLSAGALCAAFVARPRRSSPHARARTRDPVERRP